MKLVDPLLAPVEIRIVHRTATENSGQLLGDSMIPAVSIVIISSATPPPVKLCGSRVGSSRSGVDGSESVD